MYKLLQNQAVRNLHNEINDLGWGAAAEQYPEVKAHLDASLGADKFSIFMWLEAILGYCVGCQIHALLAKVGIVKDECEACNNLTF